MTPTSQPAVAARPDSATLRAAFAERRRTGGARHRDIADRLGVSEGELVAAHVDRADATPEWPMTARRLREDWPALVAGLERCGPLMALTRNASCAHEKTGVYRAASHHGGMGMVLGGDIDLRLFYTRWAHGFAVDEATPQGPQRSLQFYDARGVAVHKVFMRPATDRGAWDATIQRHASPSRRPGIEVQPAAPMVVETPDADIDRAAFRHAWASMRDTHEFFGLLQAHGVTRTQALRLADPRYAQRVDVDAGCLALNAAARDGVPIMVFVGNPGALQIHSGPVTRVASLGPWLNVLDPGFNLHLREDHVASAWVVGKPTSDGLVTSLELFDARGDTIAMVFGERKPGRTELASWRSLVAALVEETTPCAA